MSGSGASRLSDNERLHWRDQHAAHLLVPAYQDMTARLSVIDWIGELLGCRSQGRLFGIVSRLDIRRAAIPGFGWAGAVAE